MPVKGDAELRIEYGDARNPTIQYRVGGLDVRADRVLVNLSYPAVSCKPNDERVAAGQAACCGPSAGSVELVSLEELPVPASQGGCCS